MYLKMNMFIFLKQEKQVLMSHFESMGWIYKNSTFHFLTRFFTRILTLEQHKQDLFLKRKASQQGVYQTDVVSIQIVLVKLISVCLRSSSIINPHIP